MRMSISRTRMLQVSKCLIGLAVMVLQSCETVDNRRDLLCGNWESVEGKLQIDLRTQPGTAAGRRRLQI